MSENSNAGTVLTVTGPIAPDELGVTSCHEHLLMDMRNWPTDLSPEEREFAELPIRLDTIGLLRRNSWTLNYSNYRLEETATAIAEVNAFREAGGRALVELTTQGLVPDPIGVREISRATGVHVVIGCGYYIQAMHPPDVHDASIDELAATLQGEIREGVAGTAILPGIIGELGTSDVIEDDEKKVLRAAARVQPESGLAINVHTHPWGRTGLEAASILEDEGVDPQQIVISHLDNAPLDLEYHEELGRRGVWLEYDGFGKEWYVDTKRTWFPRDYERIAGLIHLIDLGYLDQIVLGCDVCLKMQLTKYGGWSYAHLPLNVVPMMLAHGISTEQVDQMLIHNPRRLLTVS